MKVDAATTLEELEGVVSAISGAVEEIRNTGVSEKALVLLIQHAAPGKVSQKAIRATLDGMESLAEFVFPEEES